MPRLLKLHWAKQLRWSQERLRDLQTVIAVVEQTQQPPMVNSVSIRNLDDISTLNLAEMPENIIMSLL